MEVSFVQRHRLFQVQARLCLLPCAVFFKLNTRTLTIKVGERNGVLSLEGESKAKKAKILPLKSRSLSLFLSCAIFLFFFFFHGVFFGSASAGIDSAESKVQKVQMMRHNYEIFFWLLDYVIEFKCFVCQRSLYN